jgi:hypothetical protein
VTITPEDWVRDRNKRAIANEVIRRAGLNLHDVAFMETTSRGWRCRVFDRNRAGKFYVRHDREGVADYWWTVYQ